MSTCESKKSACIETKITITDFEIRTTCQLNDTHEQKPMEIIKTTKTTTENQNCGDALIKVPLLSTGRERRNISPTTCILNEAFADPQSPSSSSSTSQTTSTKDATFEPTIEMMVNDFDDEQTLNEEEALASFESQDPDEEINTLKKESEMPLDELLAKYRALPPLPPPSVYSEPIRKKPKKSHKEKQKKHKQEVTSTQPSIKNSDENLTSHKVADTAKHFKGNLQYINSDSSHGIMLLDDETVDEIDEKSSSRILTPRKPFSTSKDERKEANDNPVIQTEIHKVCRSHLLDLYPEGTFDNVVVNDSIAGNSAETIYGVQDDEEDEEIEEEEDEDYKKKVMIGAPYQATIPTGLSQYGDILPYENEDKLIWEPCQVSEREVEEYLIKIRDIKSNQQGEKDEHSHTEINSVTQSKENANSDALLVAAAAAAAMEMDNQTVIKDNEQALHLLVQCGYDFKEALRRKRLNALPLNDCMSLWSEEECHKFEEGIQKYGKDFLKIRQNQVRTRTMRELVQFYYLWKKSERRDQNFANADTVDHMDIYLNEENEYGSNPASVLTPLSSPVGNISNCSGAGKNNNTPQKNISIMTTNLTTPAVTNLTTEKNGSKMCSQQHHKRRTHICNQSTHTMLASDSNCEHPSSTLTSSTK